MNKHIYNFKNTIKHECHFVGMNPKASIKERAIYLDALIKTLLNDDNLIISASLLPDSTDSYAVIEYVEPIRGVMKME